MRLLAFGDLHLKPSGKAVALDAVSVPDGTDAVVSLGDVIHRPDPDDLDLAADFLARLDGAGVPVRTVAGNHDPQPHYSALTEGLERVRSLHEATESVGGVTLVGVGCEGFDVRPELRQSNFAALDPRERAGEGDRRHLADETASRLEGALDDYVRDGLDAGALEARLDIRDGERAEFRAQLDEFDAAFAVYDRLLADAGRETVVLTHAPPFNTGLDRHHAIGERRTDIEGFHTGSLALKVALRIHRPAVSLSGHVHQRGYDVLAGAEPVHLLNLGFRGIATVEYDPASDAFAFTRHNDD